MAPTHSCTHTRKFHHVGDRQRAIKGTSVPSRPTDRTWLIAAIPIRDRLRELEDSPPTTRSHSPM